MKQEHEEVWSAAAYSKEFALNPAITITFVKTDGLKVKMIGIGFRWGFWHFGIGIYSLGWIN